MSSGSFFLNHLTALSITWESVVGWFEKFVHLPNATTDKLLKGYGDVEFEVTTEQVSIKGDPA